MLALASSSSAAVYCVNEPACVVAGGTEEGTNGNAVQKAFEAAEKHANTGGAVDEVTIGAGSYTRTEGFSYGGSDAVAIHGAGAGSTTLARAAVSTRTTMILTSVASTTLEGLTVEAPAAEDVTGLSMSAGTVRGVRIAAQDAGTSSTGLDLKGGEFTTGSIAMPPAAGSATTDVSAAGGGILTNTSLEGGEYGIQASGFPLIRGCRIAATQYGLLSYSSGPTAEDTLIDLGGKPSYGIYLDANSANAVGKFSQMTIVNGDTSAIGVLASAEAKHAANVTLENSIIAGVGRPLSVTTDSKAGTSSAVTTKYTDYEAEKAVKGGTGATISDEHLLSAPPGFVNPVATGGDWRLLATSALLGAGSPGALQAGEYEFDAAGQPRIAGGQRDVGAYEYQRRPPLASASASAAWAQTGAPVAFDGAGSSVQEAGDSIVAYAWSFDDGGAASGAQATHAFATPGTHTATLTVTDVLGITGQSSVAVAVSSPSPGQAEVVRRAPIVIDRPLRPAGVSHLKLSPGSFRAARKGPSVLRGGRGGALVSYVLAGPATVTFTVQRLVPGVMQGKACVRRKASARGGRRCTRRMTLRGSFTSAGKAGANALRFSGRLAGRKLVPGSYVLIATAVGPVARAPFGITG
ncbi:MAG TPA: PKD domain-containing protein [Solirubrobacteraceae bacterium]|nr:PKD domain-containing protein [Solirubrobacteraceae bacterium]